MIQRYTLYNPSFGDTLGNLEVDDGGDIVLWDDVKDLIEWRDLTPECRPKDCIEVRISGQTMPYTEFHGILKPKRVKPIM